MNQVLVCVIIALLAVVVSSGVCVHAADVYVRFRVVEPGGGSFRVNIGGHIHHDPWTLPEQQSTVEADSWSEWIDLTEYPVHDRTRLSGGVAEWPTLSLTILRAEDAEAVSGCAFEVQLADKPDDSSVVIEFTEESASDTIKFLVPHPLREKKPEFETGSQMTARHLRWAKEVSGEVAPKLGKFNIITAFWHHYDPNLAAKAVDTVRLLGFNVVSNIPDQTLRESGMKTYGVTWHLEIDPESSQETWDAGYGARIAAGLADENSRWKYERMTHYVVSDEIITMDFRNADPTKLNEWFRDYLKKNGETDATIGRPIGDIEYPAQAMFEKSLPRDADLPTRKIMYYAGKFGQYWTVKQLRQTTDFVKEAFKSLPGGMKTETLPADHNFFAAWGVPYCGMGYRGLDFFEIAAQEAVDIISAEDWLGLNHMYGPDHTWTGAQAYEFLNAIYRSGIGERNMTLRSLITPSDDNYLRLKAYSSLAQGSKSFFFWTFGPTYFGTENFWSDLRSEYDGIIKLTRALEKSEDVLFSAKPVTDPVAILYSVSHDMWHTDDPAKFVETRLTWAALRHLSIQPDFLREEDVEAGRLKDYKILYVIGDCLTRKASGVIDAWVKSGGTVYLAAGAATRDEFYEPYMPSFAERVWPEDFYTQAIRESGNDYNERVDLPLINPIDMARPADNPEERMPVIGYRSHLREPENGSVLATFQFEERATAGVRVNYGKGTIYAFGFLPGLAYSPFKVGQTTLDEVWPDLPRKLITMPVVALPEKERTVRTSDDVVEASLLTGPDGSAVVLANYTYKPIEKLRVTLPSMHELGQVTSAEGAEVKVNPIPGGVELELQLEWTDIILLPRKL